MYNKVYAHLFGDAPFYRGMLSLLLLSVPLITGAQQLGFAVVP